MKKLTATYFAGNVLVTFGFDTSLVALVRQLPNVRYDVRSRGFILAPASFAVVVDLYGAGEIEMGDDVRALLAPDQSIGYENPTEVDRDFDPFRPTWASLTTGRRPDGTDHQATGTTWLLRTPSGFLLDDMGCVSGEASVTINRLGNSKRMPLAMLFEKWLNGSYSDGETKIRCLDEATMLFCLGNVTNVMHTGKRPTTLLRLADGKTLELTDEHLVRTPTGWVEAAKLYPDDLVFTNGQQVCDCGSTAVVAAKAKFAGSCMPCIYRTKRNNNVRTGKWIDKDGYVRLSGYQNHPRWTTGGIYEHILVMENSIERYVGRDEVVHHINEVKNDNRISNLQLMTVKQHMTIEHECQIRLPMFIPKTVRVLSVERGRTIDVYDITVENKHTFVANGIVVHNCGKSKQFIDAATQLWKTQPVHALIVCRASNVDTWAGELAVFAPLTTTVNKYRGALRTLPMISRSDLYFCVMSYESYRNDCRTIQKYAWDWVVLDEGHAIKSNPLNKQSEIARSIHHLSHIKRKTIMSGTPMPNNPAEIYNQLLWLGLENRSWNEFAYDTLITIQLGGDRVGLHDAPPRMKIVSTNRLVYARSARSSYPT